MGMRSKLCDALESHLGYILGSYLTTDKKLKLPCQTYEDYRSPHFCVEQEEYQLGRSLLILEVRI